jgi:carboxymethylenebutenolidase
MKQLSIATDDGVCPAYDFGSGPSVLFYIDGVGMRPAMHAMGQRLASAGYRVLMPDLFWRMGPYTAPEPAKLFSDPQVRADWFKRASAAASVELIMRDTKAYLAELTGRVGVTGYCMGGRLALAAAGTYPEYIVAAAAYHPGNVANDAADSPHLLAAKMKAKIYVGGASEDATFPPEQQERLSSALRAAHVDFQLEIYPAKHGWVPSDMPVHDPVAAEKHWQTLEVLLASTLH